MKSISSTDQTNVKCVIAAAVVALVLVAVLAFGITSSSKSEAGEVEVKDVPQEESVAKTPETQVENKSEAAVPEISEDPPVEEIEDQPIVKKPLIRTRKRRGNVRELAELLEWKSGLRMGPNMKPAARTYFNYVYYYRPEKRFLDFQDYCYLYSFSTKTVIGVSALYRGTTPEATHRVHEDTVAYLERLTGGKMQSVTSMGRTIRRLAVPSNHDLQYQLEEVLPAGCQSYVELKLIDLKLRRAGAEEVRLLEFDPALKAEVESVKLIESEFVPFISRR